jgi:glycosyltransferase involved in cell wall biosynthesis
MKHNHQPIPVIIATTSALSGVSTWCFRLQEAFRHHPRYRVMLMDCFQIQLQPAYDLLATTLDDAAHILATHAPGIFIPNYLFDIMAVAARLNAIPMHYIGVCHSDSAYEYYHALTWYAPLFSHIIGVSDVCTTVLQTRLPERAADISTIIYGVPTQPRLERLYAHRPIRLIYAGRMVQQQKRVLDFITLVQQLEAQMIPYELTLVGEGREWQDLQRGLAAAIAAGRVKMIERVPESQMHHLWMTHDVFLQVSEYEGTSISMLEAMSYGVVPIVTHATSGLSMIEMGRNGFIVPVGYMAGITEIIAHLVENPHWLLHLGHAAHQSVLHFSMDNNVQKLTALFDAVCASPIRRWPSDRALEPDQPYNSQIEIWNLSAEYKQRFMAPAGP